jgi:hypothetical protein
VNRRLEARLLAEHIHHATPGGLPAPRRASPATLLAAGTLIGLAVGFIIFGGSL